MQRIVSFITMGNNSYRHERSGGYIIIQDYSNKLYNDSLSVKSSLLIEFLRTFFHEIIAHIWGYEGGGGPEHERFGTSGETGSALEGGVAELLWKQLDKVIGQRLVDSTRYVIEPNKDIIKKEDWAEAIRRLSGILMDSQIDKIRYTEALQKIYINELTK